MKDYENYLQFGDEVPSTTELVSQWVRVVGVDRPNEPWIISPYDTWEKNPHYSGPFVQHPEDYYNECLAFDECYCSPASDGMGEENEKDSIPF